jgi:hypothetical protein
METINEPDAAQTAVLHGAIVHDSPVTGPADGASRSDTDHLLSSMRSAASIGTTTTTHKGRKYYE